MMSAKTEEAGYKTLWDRFYMSVTPERYTVPAVERLSWRLEPLKDPTEWRAVLDTIIACYYSSKVDERPDEIIIDRYTGGDDFIRMKGKPVPPDCYADYLAARGLPVKRVYDEVKYVAAGHRMDFS